MWDYAIKHAIWIKNRVPTSTLPFRLKDLFVSTLIILFRAYIGDHPDFKNLRVFGCKAVPLKLNVQYPRTFEPYIKEDIWIFIRIEDSII